MKRLTFALLAVAALHASAQSIPGPDDGSTGASKPAPATNEAPAALDKPASAKANRGANSALQASIDHLTKNNQELLDLLNRQQKVLEDIQIDRRLQSRQITLLEQRLEETLHANTALETKIAKLEADAAHASANPPPSPPSPAPSTANKEPAKTNAPTDTAKSATAPAPPPPPASFLPAESTGGAPGTMWWHRLMLISGDDSEDSKTFHVSGKTWRVLWHNQDKPGAAYKNTSALFISAFPANDSIPKKVCSKLGSGGDSTELSGTGDYYLRIEASGGHWELAVEDFR